MSVDVFDPDEPEFESVEDLEIDPENDPENDPEPVAEEAGPIPRTIDVATWAARGIVVATLGLVAVVGGLLLGISVTDSTPSSAKPAPTTSSTTVPEPSETTSEPEVARVLAPPVKISTAAADRPVATTSAARQTVIATTRTTVAPAPSSSTSPTSTATPRGKSNNTGKPKPTKP